jgi:sulfotransferase
VQRVHGVLPRHGHRGNLMREQLDKNFILLSGLPRTGSTLMVSLLSQNPLIYGEGLSALCQMMWDAKQLCEEARAVVANKRKNVKNDVISGLPDLYYKGIDHPIIIEKGRTWVHPANFNMWREHVNHNQKIVVMVRPVQDIVRSFAALRKRNGWDRDLYRGILDPGQEPICRAAEAIYHAKKNLSDSFLFIDYRKLVVDPASCLNAIYELHGWEPYPHQFENIIQKNKEDDVAHGLIGMHDVRENISVRNLDVDLPEEIDSICEQLNEVVYDEKIDGIWTFNSNSPARFIGPACL